MRFISVRNNSLRSLEYNSASLDSRCTREFKLCIPSALKLRISLWRDFDFRKTAVSFRMLSASRDISDKSTPTIVPDNGAGTPRAQIGDRPGIGNRLARAMERFACGFENPKIGWPIDEPAG